MKGYLPNIVGSNKNINMNYKILNKINSSIKSEILKKYMNILLMMKDK